MGLLIDGVWSDQWYDTKASDGKFVRDVARFRNWVTSDGSAGPTGSSGFAAEAGRYHLYVSYACPWAHRTLMFRHLKDLEGLIDISVVHPLMLNDGWTFETDFNGATGDRLMNKPFMRDIYTSSYENATGRVTVPVLWDKKQNVIVSNESSEIIRMFNSVFNHLTGNHDDYWPEDRRDEIEQVNELVYHNVNNGVYKAGFATSVEAYEEAFQGVFSALDKLEDRLSENRYLVGSRLTEADIRLFATLIRFDPVYVGHFKCNLRCISDYPNLYGYMKEIYQLKDIASTVFFDHIKTHYYASHTMINPTQIVPIGPHQDLFAPHGRGHLKADPL
ncbi:MAG: glutathione S-transferase family protein [Candidatus Puniceispirillaceae bacterium]